MPLNTNTLSSNGLPKQTLLVGMHRKKQELAGHFFCWKLMEPHLPGLDLDNSIFGFLLNGVTTAWRLIAKLVVPDLACNAGNHKRT